MAPQLEFWGTAFPLRQRIMAATNSKPVRVKVRAALAAVLRTASRGGREAKNLVTTLTGQGPKAVMQMLSEDMRFVMAWRQSEARNNPFDAQLGTETGGTVPLFRLDIDSPNVTYGRHYTATPSESIHNAIRALPEDLRDFTFVDLGCGKGRVLLVAADYAFKEIIGVEFARELVHIACANCQGVNRVKVLVDDAANFKLPSGKLVVYMFNPFGGPVMDAVIQNLLQHDELVYVIYYNPLCEQMFDCEPRFVPLQGCFNTRIWKFLPDSALKR
jgi:predicted RNA methylase